MKRLLPVLCLSFAAASCVLDFEGRDGQPYCSGDAPLYEFCTLRIDGISPVEGPASGGTPVTITGGGFDATTEFLIGGVKVTDVTVEADGRTASGKTGVANLGGVNDLIANRDTFRAEKKSAFTYHAAPTVRKVWPSVLELGVTEVVIEGFNFRPGTHVKVGGVDAASVQVVDATTMRVQLPALPGKGPFVVTASHLYGEHALADALRIGGWKETKAPIAGTVHKLAFGPGSGDTQVVYAATDGGVYRSDDGGATWKRKNAGLEGSGGIVTVRDIAAAPELRTTVYAATDGGLFRSSNGGELWTLVRSSAGPSVQVVDANTVYIGEYSGEVLKSIDGGRTVTRLATGLTFAVHALSVNGATTPHQLLAADYDSVRASVDGGATWTAEFTNVIWPQEVRFVDEGAQKVPYVAGNNGLFRAAVLGTTSVKQGTLEYATSVTSRQTGTSFTVHAAFGQYVSTSPFATPVSINHSVMDLASAADGALYAAVYGYGVLKSADGLTFTPAGEGIGAPQWTALTTGPDDPTKIVAGVEGAGLVYSLDGGQSWHPGTGFTYSGIYVYGLTSHGAEPNATFVAATSDGAYSSTDRINWTRIPGQPPGLPSYAVAAAADGTLMVASYSGLYRYSGDSTWDFIDPATHPSAPPSAQFVTTLVMSADGQKVCATTYADVHCSADGGTTWTISLTLDYTTGLTMNRTGEALVWSGAKTYKLDSTLTTATEYSATGLSGDFWAGSAFAWTTSGTGLYGVDGSEGVLYSPDGGQSWTNRSAGLPGKTPRFLSAVGPLNVAAAFTGSGLHVSQTGGQ